MQSFSSHVLSESFRNLIGDRSDAERQVWATRVWDQLQATYEPVGGIRGSGFGSKEEMIKVIPFWKLYTRGDRLMVAVLYKDKSGRKMVAVGTDGSKEAKAILAGVIKADFKVSWGEVSKAMLGFILKRVPTPILLNVLLPVSKVKELMDDEILPINAATLKTIAAWDLQIYEAHKALLGPFFYIRKIGDENFLKVAIGSPKQFVK